MAATREERKIISESFAVVTKSLQPSEVIDEMRSKGLLTKNEYDKIFTETQRQRAASMVLQYLEIKQAGSLDKFIKILLHTEGQEYIGEEILKLRGPLPPNKPEYPKSSLPLDPEEPIPDVPQITEAELKELDISVTDSGDRVYQMRSSPRGLAVIINNKHFHGNVLDSKQKKREGTDKDSENLRNLFHWLDFKVVTYEDLTRDKMLKLFRNLAVKTDHRKMDCLIIAVLSHGIKGQIYAADEKLINVEDIQSMFNGRNCPTLIGKPKIFLFQACRGGTFDDGVLESVDGVGKRPTGGDTPEDVEMGLSLSAMMDVAKQYYRDHPEELKEGIDGISVKIPSEADIIVLFATAPGYVSWRNFGFGTWFVKAFVDSMYDLAETEHFTDILLEVNHRVAVDFTSQQGKKQIPQVQHHLRKKLLFNPPHPKPKYI